MDKEIRKYLIDQCKLGEPIFYEDVAHKIGLNLASNEDRNKLSETLGTISAFEHENGRPLVSSIAIYKTSKDHGPGFYNLCEQLAIGKASKLKAKFYGFLEINECKEFWKIDSNHEQFYELEVPLAEGENNQFINSDEIDFFKMWANRIYVKNNDDHYRAKEYLLDTVWGKTKFWSDEVVKRLEKYETSNGRYWSKKDWQDGKRVASFKPYTWARIFKKGHKKNDIFFTVGIDPLANALIYKLDYYHEGDSKLSKEQKEQCSRYIPASIKWNEIPQTDLDNWDWESLIRRSVDFISSNSHHYDQLVALIWGNAEEVFTNNLTLRNFPDGGFLEPPKPNPKFHGIDIDFFKKNKDDKELGDLGEELVLEYEQNKLKEKGMHDFADKVRIVKDGEGYDVFSYDENGQECYIEVKTTRGNEKTPFYLSLNERMFYEQNSSRYIIYRLYNYNSETDYADFFKIENLNEQLLFQPTQFKVYLRKN